MSFYKNVAIKALDVPFFYKTYVSIEKIIKKRAVGFQAPSIRTANDAIEQSFRSKRIMYAIHLRYKLIYWADQRTRTHTEPQA